MHGCAHSILREPRRHIHHGGPPPDGHNRAGQRLDHGGASALPAAAFRRVGTTRLATTSVRLWVVPPARKKRRRTRPVTRSSSPASHDAAEAGADGPGDRHGLGAGAVGADGELEGDELIARRERAELGIAAQHADEDGEVGPRAAGWWTGVDMGASDGAGADVEGEGGPTLRRGCDSAIEQCENRTFGAHAPRRAAQVDQASAPMHPA